MFLGIELDAHPIDRMDFPQVMIVFGIKSHQRETVTPRKTKECLIWDSFWINQTTYESTIIWRTRAETFKMALSIILCSGASFAS